VELEARLGELSDSVSATASVDVSIYRPRDPNHRATDLDATPSNTAAGR